LSGVALFFPWTSLIETPTAETLVVSLFQPGPWGAKAAQPKLCVSYWSEEIETGFGYILKS
jgi:hypothetical protein